MKSILFYTNPTHFPATQQTATISTQKANPSKKWRILQPLNCAINEPKPSKNGAKVGGYSALKSLLDINVNLSCDHSETYPLPSRPSAQEVNDIKMEAVRLMKYGKAKDAISLLRKAYELYKDDLEPAYNVEMALVEILISQGKYLEASDCNCLKDDQRLPSDARFPLYKAIICTMLGETEEAKKWWDEYAETFEGEFDPTKLT